MIYEYEGLFLKLVVVVSGVGETLKAECRVIDMRTVRQSEA